MPKAQAPLFSPRDGRSKRESFDFCSVLCCTRSLWLIVGGRNEETEFGSLGCIYRHNHFLTARPCSAVENGDHGAHHRKHRYGSPRVQREPRLLQKAGTRCPADYGAAKRRDHCRNCKRRTQLHGYYSHCDFSVGERTADQDDCSGSKPRALCAYRATQLAIAR